MHSIKYALSFLVGMIYVSAIWFLIDYGQMPVEGETGLRFGPTIAVGQTVLLGSIFIVCQVGWFFFDNWNKE